VYFSSKLAVEGGFCNWNN